MESHFDDDRSFLHLRGLALPGLRLEWRWFGLFSLGALGFRGKRGRFKGNFKPKGTNTVTNIY